MLIILLLGPSAAGKSHISKKLKNDHNFLYIQIEKNNTESFKANGLPSGWDKDLQSVDYALFINDIRSRLADKHSGAVVSYPTVYLLDAQKLADISLLGWTPVVLWGTQEHCIQACKERRRANSIRFNADDLKRYKRLNMSTFEAYGSSEYDYFREEVFQEDGTHRSDDELLARIIERAVS